MSQHALLAVPITCSDPPLDQQVEAACAAGADIVELRVDWLEDVGAVASLLEQPRTVPVILTIRSAEEGGGWDGSDNQRIALFERLGRLRPGYLDVEYTAWRGPDDVRQRIGRVCDAATSGPTAAEGRTDQPSGNQLILSIHDWCGTPADLDADLEPLLLESRADIVKVVFTARDATDAWRVLEWLHRNARGRKLIALAMGEPGLLTRVLAGKFGGFLTFAALRPDRRSAPGQPSAQELLHTYRWRDVGPQTRVFGVIGWPVSHSRSPSIHNAAMAAADIDGVFVPMPVAPAYDDFAAAMDYLTQHPELDVFGLSITIPHKEHALRWLDRHDLPVSAMARRIGAVNTLTRSGRDKWAGDNTDVSGALAALRTVAGADLTEIRGCHVAVLGAGGAARAVIVALLDHGCRVTVFNRTAKRSELLAQQLCCAWQPWQDRARADAQIIVNCTSLGMHPDVDASPLPPDAVRPGLIVLDTVYTPAETRLLRQARDRDCRTVSGVTMFIGQAAAQFDIWHHRPAPTDVMQARLALA